MKKTLTIMAVLLGAVGAYAQGTIQFSDYDGGAYNNAGWNASVWAPNPSSPTVQQYGNSSSVAAGDIPTGSTSFGGVQLGGSATGGGDTTGTSAADYANGNLWSVQLYAGAGSGLSLGSLFAINAATATLGTTADTQGNWLDGANVDVSLAAESTGLGAGFGGIAAGGTGTFALAAWYNGGANGYTFADSPVKGFSAPVTITLIGPPTPGTSSLAGSTFGPTTSLESFSLAVATPEPSTIALGVIGASAFLMRLRRKQ